MNKELHLVLKTQWWDKIVSGEKKEEYRKISPHWITRIIHKDCLQEFKEKREYAWFEGDITTLTKGFTQIVFHKGYTNQTRTYELNGISIGFGKPCWGAPKEQIVFILKIGKSK